MRRRELVIFLTIGALGAPIVARAQQAMPVIGFLNPQSQDGYAERMRGFRQGLKDTGYVEARMSGSNTAGGRIRVIECRRWRPIWSAAQWQ